MAKLFANSGDPDQTRHSAASDLGLHCLQLPFYGSPNYSGLTTTTADNALQSITFFFFLSEKIRLDMIYMNSQALFTLKTKNKMLSATIVCMMF